MGFFEGQEFKSKTKKNYILVLTPYVQWSHKNQDSSDSSYDLYKDGKVIGKGNIDGVLEETESQSLRLGIDVDIHPIFLFGVYTPFSLEFTVAKVAVGGESVRNFGNVPDLTYAVARIALYGKKIW